MKRFIIAAVIAGLLGAGCATFHPDPADPEKGHYGTFYDPYNEQVARISCGQRNGAWNFDDCVIEVKMTEEPPWLDR